VDWDQNSQAASESLLATRRRQTLQREKSAAGDLPQYYNEQVFSESLIKLGKLAVRLNEVLRYGEYDKLQKAIPQQLQSLKQDYEELMQETY
jgi:hypothetical protein